MSTQVRVILVTEGNIAVPSDGGRCLSFHQSLYVFPPAPLSVAPERVFITRKSTSTVTSIPIGVYVVALPQMLPQVMSGDSTRAIMGEFLVFEVEANSNIDKIISYKSGDFVSHVRNSLGQASYQFNLYKMSEYIYEQPTELLENFSVSVSIVMRPIRT